MALIRLYSFFITFFFWIFLILFYHFLLLYFRTDVCYPSRMLISFLNWLSNKVCHYILLIYYHKKWWYLHLYIVIFDEIDLECSHIVFSYPVSHLNSVYWKSADTLYLNVDVWLFWQPCRKTGPWSMSLLSGQPWKYLLFSLLKHHLKPYEGAPTVPVQLNWINLYGLYVSSISGFGLICIWLIVVGSTRTYLKYHYYYLLFTANRTYKIHFSAFSYVVHKLEKT